MSKSLADKLQGGSFLSERVHSKTRRPNEERRYYQAGEVYTCHISDEEAIYSSHVMLLTFSLSQIKDGYYILHANSILTFMDLADAFNQSDIQCF